MRREKATFRRETCWCGSLFHKSAVTSDEETGFIKLLYKSQPSGEKPPLHLAAVYCGVVDLARENNQGKQHTP
jgi:hypothetical protein